MDMFHSRHGPTLRRLFQIWQRRGAIIGPWFWGADGVCLQCKVQRASLIIRPSGRAGAKCAGGRSNTVHIELYPSCRLATGCCHLLQITPCARVAAPVFSAGR